MVCPDYEPDLQRRLEVEAQLPVMTELWETWRQVRAGLPTSPDRLPWRNESGEVRQFLARLMYEGGRLAGPHCEELLSDCRGLKHHKIFTEKGICLEISSGGLLLSL